jgi:hypothetical protein
VAGTRTFTPPPPGETTGFGDSSTRLARRADAVTPAANATVPARISHITACIV